ncbi:MAG: tyrosine-protein phosphatase [Sphingomonadales bacterium]|nr:tyrosine-protein phosphatase [Sphingomonadales bacterium]
MARVCAVLVASLLAPCAGAVHAAPPAAAVVERQAPDRLTIRWTSSDPVDVLAADRPGAGIAQAHRLVRQDRDGRFETAVPGDARPYFLLRNSRTGEVTRVAERMLPLEAGSNFRDIGGYPAAGGRLVRWGMIYRSGGTPLLTAGDVARIRSLHLATMVDLRSDEERVLAPTRIDGVAYVAVGYSFAGLDAGAGMEATYRRLPTMMAPQLRQIFARLLQGDQPLAYNCSAGQDRTGFVTAMVLGALGTPRETILADYHLSTRYRRPAFEMPHLDLTRYAGNPVAEMFGRFQDDPAAREPRPLKTADGRAYLEFALAEIDRQWGSTDGYLRREIGLTPADIARLRARYTE